jgi:hypothetical protein
MPSEVEIRLITNNSQAVKGIRQIAEESKKTSTSVETSNQKQKKSIEDLNKAIKDLWDTQKKGFSTAKQVEDYTKKMADLKKELDDLTKSNNELDESQKEVEKTGGGLLKSVGNWAAGFVSLTSVLGLLKKAFSETEAGLKTFNTIGAVTKQIFYGMVTGDKLLLSGIILSVKANNELEKQRIQQRKNIVEIAKAQRIYDELYFESSKQTKTGAERLTILNQAMIQHELLMDKKITNAKDELHGIELLLAARPEETELLDAHARKLAEIEGLEGERVSETRRLETQRTGIIKEELDKRKNKLEEYQELSLKLLDDYDKSNIESLKGTEKLKAIRDFGIKQIYELRIQLAKLGTVTKEQDAIFEGLAANVWKAFYEGMAKEGKPTPAQKTAISKALLSGVNKAVAGIQPNKAITPTKETEFSVWKLIGIDTESDEGQKMVENFKTAANEIYSVIDSINDQRVEDTKRNRELLDTQISELESELETEAELYKAGYASNVEGKKKELEEIKKQRELALAEESEALKKQRNLDSIQQASSLLTASANIIKGWSTIPLVGQVLAIAAIAAMFTAFASARVQANKVTKLAKGAHGEITGRSHSEGGERFLDHIEVEQGEKWGVLSRPASRKYGRIFENMVDSFNKDKLMIPESISNNNILVENTGPNKRLDEVNHNLKRMSAKEDTQIIGNVMIIRKGNRTRKVRL